jgi:hypothetical protein
MKISSLIAALALIGAFASFLQADDKKPAPKWPAAGAETPDGAMTYLFNVTGPEAYRDRFHCLVTEYALDPTVMILIQGVDTLENPGVLALLQQLDQAVTRNKLKRLHAFVVVLDPSLQDVVKQDVPRYRLKKKVDAVVKAETNKLGNGEKVPFCICTPNQLKDYRPAETAALTAVFTKNHIVVRSDVLSKDDLKEDKLTKLLADGLAELLPSK